MRHIPPSSPPSPQEKEFLSYRSRELKPLLSPSRTGYPQSRAEGIQGESGRGVLQPLQPRLRARRGRDAGGAVADPAFNAEQTIELMRERAAAERAVAGAVPGARPVGLHLRRPVPPAGAARRLPGGAARGRCEASRGLPLVAVVGLPLQVDHLLFNCAASSAAGAILGVVPEDLPAELPRVLRGAPVHARRRRRARRDRAARPARRAVRQPTCSSSVEQPAAADASTSRSARTSGCRSRRRRYAALAGATVLLNLSASNITVGKADYRHQLVGSQSARCLAAYLYSAAGPGESTTDLAWDGHALIVRERQPAGRVASASPTSRSSSAPRSTSSGSRQSACARPPSASRRCATGRDAAPFRTVPLRARAARRRAAAAARRVRALPLRPADPAHPRRALRGGLQHPGPGPGQAAAVHRHQEARDRRLGRARLDPGAAGLRPGDGPARLPAPATSWPTPCPASRPARARCEQAHAADAGDRLQRRARSTSARAACQMLKDIGHPYAERREGLRHHLRERAGRRAHQPPVPPGQLQPRRLVVGTGDLSELALGWCTYGVGDHMSHYNVNASVPKTLIQHLIRWVAETDAARAPRRSDALLRHPGDRDQPGAGARRRRRTQPARSRPRRSIGPYELQDFNLYYTLRFGYAPPKVAFLAYCAWHDRQRGAWPDDPDGAAARVRHRPRSSATWASSSTASSSSASSSAAASRTRPKVGSGGSLSPRGDWRAPSDGEATAWLSAARAGARRRAPSSPRRRLRSGVHHKDTKTPSSEGVGYACSPTIHYLPQTKNTWCLGALVVKTKSSASVLRDDAAGHRARA